MDNILVRFFPFFLFISLSAHASLEKFKTLIQNEIVNGMAIANDDDYPIEYGEQGNADSPQGELDKRFWEKIGNYTFKLKGGVSAADAIESIFPTSQEQDEVLLECHSMMTAIIYRAILKGLGKKQFDNYFGKKGSGYELKMLKYGDLKASGLEPFFQKKKIPKNKIELGDWVYFRNHPDYLAKHPDGAWQGENAIYVGKSGERSYFSGFGASELTEDEMNYELLKIYNQDQTIRDQEILKKQWNALLRWLIPNSSFRKENYFQLNQNLFSDIDSDINPEDYIDELFEPVAKALGYKSVSYFSSEFTYGVDEYDTGKYIFWLEKATTYKEKVTLKEIPGIVRVDRLDFEKLYQLK